MKVLPLQEILKIENEAILKLGIPRIALMESAGAQTAKVILHTLGRRGPVLVLAGKGFNGGDALVAARYLRNQGVPLEIACFSSESALKKETRTHFKVLQKSGVPITTITTKQQMKKFSQKLGRAVTVVDGLLGTGLSHPVKGILRDVIHLVNRERANRPATFPMAVVAVDIPSGLETDSGKPNPEAIQADVTITFHAPKPAHGTGAGARAAGKLYVADIGIPRRDITPSSPIEPIQWDSKTVQVVTGAQIASLLGMRHTQSHKGTYGHILMIAGSNNMPGAAVLACRAALRTGAGLVTLAAPRAVTAMVATALPEVIHLPLSQDDTGGLTSAGLSRIEKEIGKYSVIACGPGLSQSRGASLFVTTLLAQKWDRPLVLDADTLNIIAAQKLEPSSWRGPVIMTPHPGELGRLLGKTIGEIQNRRVEYAKRAARRFKAIIVLKGAGTVIAAPEGETLINSTGNPGMATAGTGDVLTGMIAGFLAQQFGPLPAAAAAVYLHGFAGDTVAETTSPEGLMASDVIEAVPSVISAVRHGQGNGHV